MYIPFQNRLKESRKERNLTQKQLSRDLCISASTLSHWECGYQEPSFEDIIMLCKYFQVTANYILGLED